MTTRWQKPWTLMLVCIVALCLSACQKEEEEGEPEEKKPGETRDDPISSDPTPDPDPDPDPDPIEGKDLVIIGNHEKEDDPGYSQEGVWQQSVLPGFDGSISRYSETPQARVEYESDDIGKARYCVSVYRVTHSNSIDMAKWTLFEGEEEKHREVIRYNLDVEDTGWVSLGEFSFSGKKTVRLQLERHVEANKGFLRADEVRLHKLPKGHDCYGKTHAEVGKKAILDNKKVDGGNDPGYREHGIWKESRLPGLKGRISRYSEQKEASVTYSFIPKKANYCLSLYRVTHSNSVKRALVEIKQEDVILGEFVIDHRLPVDRAGWIGLDRIAFKPKRPANLTIKRADGAKGILRADALRFETKPHACR